MQIAQTLAGFTPSEADISEKPWERKKGKTGKQENL